MRFPKIYTLKEIADLIQRKFIGNENFQVIGTNEIHRVTKGEIVFVDHPKYYDKALNSDASIILINKIVDCPEGKALIISENPFSDFNKINNYFFPFINSNSSISASAQIGENTIIQPNVFIGNHVKIGSNCVIHANVTINDYTEIGNNVVIQSGTVIGSDAFYYKNRENHFERLLSVGKVIIEDFVEIGSNCTIDRGVTDVTFIGKGTVLDNLIQIGHETKIGKKCLIASQVGIAGCCTIDDEVTIWGQVGIKSDIKIAKKVIVLAQSGVGKNLEEGKTYFGSPAEEAREYNRRLIIMKNLPNIIKEIKNKF